MFKPKAESFRKQIRREYLNEYFKKKRKEFNLVPNIHPQQNMSKISKIQQSIKTAIQQNNQMIPEKGIADITLNDLNLIAKFSQTQMGVQTLLKTGIPAGILPYLFPFYHNKTQQYLATCFFANITYLKSQISPSHQFMRNLINIIENTDLSMQIQVISSNPRQQQEEQKNIRNILLDTIDNCLQIIFNLILDFPTSLEFYINQCNLVGLMFSMLDMATADQIYIVDKLLKIMVLVTGYFKGKKDKYLVKKFLKIYISIFENTNEEKFIHLTFSNIRELIVVYVDAIQSDRSDHKYGQYDHGSCKNNQSDQELLQIVTQIVNSKFLQKMKYFYPRRLSGLTKFTLNLFFILKVMLPKMKRQAVEGKLLPLLNNIIDGLYGSEGVEFEENILNLKSQKSEQTTIVEPIYAQTCFYQIIYALLQIWPSNHEILTKHRIFDKICDRYIQFEQTHSSGGQQAKQARQYFIYVFGLLSFSGHLPRQLRMLVRRSIERWREGENGRDLEGRRREEEEFGSLEGFVGNVENMLEEEGQCEYEI